MRLTRLLYCTWRHRISYVFFLVWCFMTVSIIKAFIRILCPHIEAGAKWPPLCQTILSNTNSPMKMFNFDKKNSLTFAPDGPVNNFPPLVQIMAWHRPGRRQAIIWTNDGIVYWRSYASLGLNEFVLSLRWRHNERYGVSNHQLHDCLLNRLFRPRSKKTSKLRVTGLCVGNSPGPVNSPHKGPVTRKTFPFDDVIMKCNDRLIRNMLNAHRTVSQTQSILNSHRHLQMLFILTLN